MAHLEIGKESLRKLIEEEGKTVLRPMQRAELTPEWSSEDCQTELNTTRMYLRCDGVKVPLMTAEEKKKRRQHIRIKRRRRGRKCKPLTRAQKGTDRAYKYFKVSYFYDEEKKHRYVGVTSGRILRRMSDQIQLSRMEEKIALIDEASWIRNPIEFQGLTLNIGLDFYPLQDNAHKARRHVFGEKSETGEAWVSNLMYIFKHNGYEAAWDIQVSMLSLLRSPQKRAALNQS